MAGKAQGLGVVALPIGRRPGTEPRRPRCRLRTKHPHVTMLVAATVVLLSMQVMAMMTFIILPVMMLVIPMVVMTMMVCCLRWCLCP